MTLTIAQEVARLLRRNAKGQGPHQVSTFRLPLSFNRALQARAQQLGVPKIQVLIQAALAGDPELRQLRRQYAKTGEEAK